MSDEPKIYDAFTLKCTTKALEHYKMNPNAIIIKARSLEAQLMNHLRHNGGFYIHPSLSPIGKSEALSHELYGHGLLYNQYRSRSLSGHDYIKSRDNNDLLRSYIRRTRMETISYFKLNIE
ncbi:MAG: hypothetical protein ACI4A7_05355 [Prevotella sp.]